MAARVASLAWTLAMSQRRIHDCPSLLGFSTAGAAGAAPEVLMQASSSCVIGRSMASPGRQHPGRCKRMPCASSWWFKMCSCRARSQSCCQLGRPRVFVLSGGQLRPTESAMAAPLGPNVVKRGSCKVLRRGRPFADEAVHGKPFASEKQHLLNVKCSKNQYPDSDVTFFPGNKPVSRRSTSLTFESDFYVFMIGRGALRCQDAESEDLLRKQQLKRRPERERHRTCRRENIHNSTLNKGPPKVKLVNSHNK